jgi:thioredoxin-related protein
MRARFVLLFVLLSLHFGEAFSQDKIHWMTISEMQVAMTNEPRKVLIDVYTNWCGPCRMMMSQTFTNPEVIAYINENFYAVKFNGEGDEAITFHGKNYVNNAYNPANANKRNSTHQFTKAIAPVNGKIAYPTIVYMDEELSIISPVQGFWKAQQLLPLLHFIDEDVYKSDTTFDQYLKSYQKK